METVVFPSPEAVGLMAVTKTSLALRAEKSPPIFALKRPYDSKFCGAMPSSAATSAMSRKAQFSAISISLNISKTSENSLFYLLPVFINAMTASASPNPS